jgi:hypothetical protein
MEQAHFTVIPTAEPCKLLFHQIPATYVDLDARMKPTQHVKHFWPFHNSLACCHKSRALSQDSSQKIIAYENLNYDAGFGSKQ